MYDCTTGPIWRRAVYGPLHDGDEFINLGGRRLLDTIARRTRLTRGSSVLELGCGRGATCRYFADRHGCAVTGVDLNPRQIDVSRSVPCRAGSLRFVEADLLDWVPDAPFDVVASLDTFMLLPDPFRAMVRMREAARPGGWVWVSAVAGGPALSDERREWFWTSDGMLSLPDAPAYAAVGARAGLVDLAVEDWTALATAASERMLAALDDQRAVIAAEAGGAAFEEWREAAVIYLDAFRDGALTYLLVSGRVPDAEFASVEKI